MPKQPSHQVNIMGLTGMNNLKESRGYLLNDAKMAAPQTILNADVLPDGVVTPRRGRRKVINLPGAHSLWSGSLALCVADGVLMELRNRTPVQLGVVNIQPDSRMRYVEYNGVVYMSNGYWSQALETTTGTLRAWGLSVPTPPTVTGDVGDLPPGVYKLCYTRYVNGQLSGNSGIVEVGWEGGLGGLRFTNKPADCLAWISQANGMELFLAPVDGTGRVTSPNYTQPLPTFGVTPPSPFSYMDWGHGRLWGVRGKELWFSDEFRPEYFRQRQRFPFPEPLVNIAIFDNGVYVNSLNKTWSLMGRDPAKMTLHVLGSGALNGDVVYAQVEGAGYEVSKTLSQVESPVWVSKAGMIVGTHTGHLVHITETRLRINARGAVAGLRRVVEGRQQVLFTLSGPVTTDPDQTALADFKRGRLFVPSPATINARGGLAIGGQGEFS